MTGVQRTVYVALTTVAEKVKAGGYGTGDGVDVGAVLDDISDLDYLTQPQEGS